MTFKPQDRQNRASEGKVSGFGGYSTRHEYERSRTRESVWIRAGKIALILTLVALAVVGTVSLIRGDFLPDDETVAPGNGSIKVPTRSELSELERPLEEAIASLQGSLLTLEVELADGTYRWGTGFLVSDDGYAVCASRLFSQPELLKTPHNFTAYIEGGFSASVELKGTEPELGIALLHLETGLTYTPVSVKNSAFVERGEKLVAVGAHKAKRFYGTVVEGLVASVGPAVKVGEGSVNVLYLDLTPDSTLYGAPVIDQSGAVAGFCTDAIEPLYGLYTAVVPINTVYTVINDMLSEG